MALGEQQSRREHVARQETYRSELLDELGELPTWLTTAEMTARDDHFEGVRLEVTNEAYMTLRTIVAARPHLTLTTVGLQPLVPATEVAEIIREVEKLVQAERAKTAAARLAATHKLATVRAEVEAALISLPVNGTGRSPD